MRAAIVLGLLLATTALAAKPKVIVDASGPMKALLTRALSKKFTPVSPRSDLPDEPSSKAVKQAVREAGAVGLVTARLSNGVWEVMALNGADGSPIEQFKFKAPGGKKPVKALPKGTNKRLEAALAKAKAPGKEREEVKKEEPKEEPRKEEPTKEESVAEAPKKVESTRSTRTVKETPKEDVEEKTAEEVSSPSDGADQPVALNLAVGLKLFARRFYYNQDIFQSLSKYNLPVGPALQVEADWFPGAHFTKGPAANVGISFGFNYALGISSVANDGTRYGTSASRLRLAVMGRIKLGILELQPHFGWVMQSYTIAGGATGTAKPNVPDVRYSNLRVGLGTKLSLFGPLAVTAGFAYQAPLSTGEISSAAYFPRLKAGGLDANFGVTIGPLFNHVELRLSVDYIRYWFTLNPEPGDASVAGGALDDYRGASLMVAFTL